MSGVFWAACILGMVALLVSPLTAILITLAAIAGALYGATTVLRAGRRRR